jgi:nitroimidazol reductase NimA-like FMN-containing flavoprotein (pyridoxamine 5'-phosphate oxidase superfamily)
VPPPPPRSAQERKQDVVARLERDTDAWVASADQDGFPYLVPLSFLWDGTDLVFATPATSPTGRNLRASGRVRIGIGPTRDVVLVEGRVTETLRPDEISADLAVAFAEKTGFDPRTSEDMRYFRIRPDRVQAWREANELKGRELMRHGHWLV